MRVESEMAAVERGNRQQVENADSHRQQGNQLHQPFEAELGRLAGHVGDLDRPAELAIVFAPDDEALQELAGALDDVAGLLDRFANRAGRAVVISRGWPRSVVC